jgi:hypothetical protein
MIIALRIFQLNLGKQLIYRGFLEDHDAENLHHFVGRLAECVAVL